MTVRLQVVIAAAILVVLAVLGNMIRRKKLGLKYALPWKLGVAGLFGFARAAPLLNVVSEVLGIYAPGNMIFFFAFVLFSL